VWVGWFGQGTVNVTEFGELSTMGDVSLAVQPGSQGTMNISNNAYVQVKGDVHVGGGAGLVRWATSA
jgi:hypothetical protein